MNILFKIIFLLSTISCYHNDNNISLDQNASCFNDIQKIYNIVPKIKNLYHEGELELLPTYLLLFKSKFERIKNDCDSSLLENLKENKTIVDLIYCYNNINFKDESPFKLLENIQKLLTCFTTKINNFNK